MGNPIERQQRTLTLDNGRFTYLASNKNLGWANVAFSLGTYHGTGKGGFEYYTHAASETFKPDAVTELEHGYEMKGQYSANGLEETITLRLLHNGALRIDRVVTNHASASHVIRSAALGGAAGGKPVFSDNHIWRARYCHMDNVRTEKFPWCRPEYPYVRPLPKSDTVFGNQESQPVPAMILTNDSHSQLLLEGQLDQQRTRAQWTLSAGAGEPIRTWELHWSMHNAGFELQPGESLTLEPMYFQAMEDTHPQDCWDDYFEALSAETNLQDESNILLSKAFYCSWNYGVFQDISEAKLLKTARFVGQHMPDVKHFLIDGGWQSQEAVSTPSCANFYLPEGQWHDAELFPNGMKAMADRIREAGVTPAIWWTPSVALHSTLAKEHPEWLAKDAAGNVFRIGNSGYLDYSLKPCQDYLHKAFSIMFNNWGYEAMKMDFWCHSVESEQIRYATGTGMHWRNWLLETIRSYLPDDGFLMTCVAVAMGNPFLGKSASTYRCSIDVGACDWREHVTSCVWNLPLHALPGRQSILANIDGFGWSDKMTDDENMHRLTYTFITMGSLEIDGRLEDLPMDKIALLNKVMADADRGHPVKCHDLDAFTGRPLPKCLSVAYPQGSRTAKRGIASHIALFNWSDQPQHTFYDLEQLGIQNSQKVTDFWTGETVTPTDSALGDRLAPRSARLYEVR